MPQKHIQSIPVVRASAREYELAALVGNDAIILGWTMANSIDRSDLLGFCVKRVTRDLATQRETESRWLSNHRRFAQRGEAKDSSDISTYSDPLQQFSLLDHAFQRGCTATYSVVPVRGTPALKYFEAPISVTVSPEGFEDATGSADDLELGVRDTRDQRSALVVSPNARQDFHNLSVAELALSVQRLTDQARSAVLLYSSIPLPEEVLAVVRKVNSGRLLYGLVPQQANDTTSTSLSNGRAKPPNS